MINLLTGFILCFSLLLIMGQLKRILLFFKKHEISKHSNKGPDEQIKMGETVVAVINSGESNKKVITNIGKPRLNFWKRILN